MFVDSHNHLLDYLEKLYKKDNFTKEELLLAYDNLEVIFCTSANEESRFTKQEAICNLLNSNVHPFHSFGIHPQAPSLLEIPFLEKLLKLKKMIYSFLKTKTYLVFVLMLMIKKLVLLLSM